MPSHAALEATPAGGSGEWGAGSGGGGGGLSGGGGGGLRGRGSRGSAESSMGAREAHAYAQAASAAPPEAVAAAEEERDSDRDRDRDRFLDLDSRAEGGRASTSTVHDFPRIVEALSCYKRVHGHLRMIPGFKVPPNAPWPEHLYGMDLGRSVR